MKWLADETFRNAIIRGLVRRAPALDIVRAQDVPEIAGQSDLTLLKFATAEGRLVVTHDLSTMLPARLEQMRLESQCAPIVLLADSLPVNDAINDLLILNECAVEADWAGGVIYIPLRWCQGGGLVPPAQFGFLRSCVTLGDQRRVIITNWAALPRAIKLIPATFR